MFEDVDFLDVVQERVKYVFRESVMNVSVP
jgi:hypothetical protein